MKRSLLLSIVFIYVSVLAAQNRSALPVKATDSAIASPVSMKAVGFASSETISMLARQGHKKPAAPFDKHNAREVGGSPVTSAYPASTQDSDRSLARSNGVAMPTPSISFGGLSNYDNIDVYQA